MTEGTHQPLTIEDIRWRLSAYDEAAAAWRQGHGDTWEASDDERALRMLVAVWEVTEPRITFDGGRDQALKDVRRAIFGRTEETG